MVYRKGYGETVKPHGITLHSIKAAKKRSSDGRNLVGDPDV